MLELWIGRPEMKKALKAYLEKHQYTGATSDDFFKAVFDSTKKEKELKPFKDAWLSRKGYPVLFTDTAYNGGKLTLTIRQQPSSAGEKGAFVFKLPIVIHRNTEPAYTKEETILVDKPEVKVTLDVPATPQWINWNKNFGALAKINASSISEDQWVDAARNDPDPVWRLIAARNLLGELASPTVPKEETKPTDSAMGALTDLLQKDASAYVREAILDKLARTRFKQLPKEMAPMLLTLAKRPDGLSEDPVGYIRVRRAAMAALARVESPDGHRYLIDELSKREVDINYLGAFAEAVARIGTPSALTSLKAAVVTQKGRGMPYYRRAVAALGMVSSVDVMAAIRDAAKQNPGNNEVLRPIFEAADRNRELKDTEDYTTFVRDFVLDEQASGDDLRELALRTLDDVKYEAAKQALTAIVEKATSERMKASARVLLNANFPAPPAAPVTPDKKAAPKK
jgi:aminopeptidase N